MAAAAAGGGGGHHDAAAGTHAPAAGGIPGLAPPVDFAAWVERVKPELQPPVGNKLLYGDGQHKVMVVGGPNVRKDYHIEEGEEIFLQLVGPMCVEAMEHGKHKPVVIREGEIFMLPGYVPHSPQRQAGTIGLVLERERLPEERDGLCWYTPDGSGRVLFQQFFYCKDLGVELKPAIEAFMATEAYKTGVPAMDYSKVEAPIKADTARVLTAPFHLATWIRDVAAKSPTNSAVLFGAGAVEAAYRGCEYHVEVATGPVAAWAEWRPVAPGELFLYQMEGTSTVDVRHVATGAVASYTLPPAHMFLLPGGGVYAVKAAWGVGAAMIVTNARVVPSA